VELLTGMKWTLFGVMLALWASSLMALPAYSQPNQPTPAVSRSSSSKDPEGRQLRDAIQQNLGKGSVEVTDSLLQMARRQGHQSGQVVTLSQLAALYAEQGQSQIATDLMAQATALGAQLQSVNEAAWAMKNLGQLQQQYRQRSALFMSVFSSLGMAMNTGSVFVGRGRRGMPDSTAGQSWKVGRSTHQNGVFMPMPPPPGFPDRGDDGSPLSRPRIRMHFTDQWLDSLIKANLPGSALGQQLNTKKKLRDSSQQLSTAFAKQGDYARAYTYFLQYTAYKDSLAAEVTANQVALLQYKQTNQKKEAQINLLTKERQLRDQEADRQRQLLAALGGWVVLLLAAAVLLIRANRARKRTNQQLNDQKQALQETLSELKATQSQLIQSEKMASLGELTSGIAHEIQNPLNFVNNFAEVSAELVAELSEEARRPDRDSDLEGELLADLGQNLAKITHHGNRASAIVRSMAEHSRSIVGEKQPADLNVLAQEYLKVAYHAMQTKVPTFEAILLTDFDADAEPILVVAEEVGRVLLNVFNNALYALCQRQQAGGPTYKPVLSVSTKQMLNALVLRIRDNGTGIPAKVRQKVFQPFFTTKPSGEGTGMGLSLSYDIITKGYGGTIDLETEEGQFTEFIITLPRS
jgi:two-component system, NtrC family, sensor kinase